MLGPSVRAILLATVAAAMPGMAVAQFTSPPGQHSVQQRWPEPPKPAPAAPAASQAQAAPAQPAPAQAAPAQAPRPKPAPQAEPKHTGGPNVVTCGGVFAKNSTHLKLAIKYDSRNLVFGDVDGPDGSKLKASILFPNDPRRRLEVLWENEPSRSDTSLIAINGRSTWSGPKGIKLGLPLATLEKINGRPFKLSGFGADGIASVAGWEGGALEKLPGGCKVGVRVHLDRKSPEAARHAAAEAKELMSNDAKARGVKPSVMEILIGY